MSKAARMVSVAAALGALLVGACNTMAGVGKDLQRAGEGLENTGQGRSW